MLVVVFAEVYRRSVDAVGYSDLPVDWAWALPIPVEVVDAQSIVTVQATPSAGVVHIGVAVTVPAIVETSVAAASGEAGAVIKQHCAITLRACSRWDVISEIDLDAHRRWRSTGR